MTPELGKKLIRSIDEAYTSFIQNSTADLVCCMLCGEQMLQVRAPYYATIYTNEGTLYYPVCMACVDLGIAEGKAAGERWLAKNERKAMTA